jgi:hypothetical protein
MGENAKSPVVGEPRDDLVSLHVSVFRLNGEIVCGGVVSLRGKTVLTEARGFGQDEEAACEEARELMLRLALRLSKSGGNG